MTTTTFHIGDHVGWNSEAGRVSGHIVGNYDRAYHRKGHTHHASPEDPQYEIRSDKTEHLAVHKGAALRLLKN